jgi:hypothetical protein
MISFTLQPSFTWLQCIKGAQSEANTAVGNRTLDIQLLVANEIAACFNVCSRSKRNAQCWEDETSEDQNNYGETSPAGLKP